MLIPVANCWFVSQLDGLAVFPTLIDRSIPHGQSFQDGRYSGGFVFRFWVYGKWKTVVVDVSLPSLGCQKTAMTRVQFMH